MRYAKFNLGNDCQHHQTLGAREPPKLIIAGVTIKVTSLQYVPAYLRDVSNNPTKRCHIKEDNDLHSQNRNLNMMMMIQTTSRT
jgi:hypothetical protein